VRFLYDEEAQTAPRPSTGPVRQPAVPSANLPSGWVRAVEQATVKADLNGILALADRIRGIDALTADALADLARGYQYREILNWLEQAGGSNE
jgi:hypothetical protein